MEPVARLYLCVRCQCQVMICSDCDRGNIYCGPVCSRAARACSRRRTAHVYQKSLRGRHQHAERQRRYRQRQTEKVTHQGSLNESFTDLLPHEPVNEAEKPSTMLTHCHFCGKSCSSFVRRLFLEHRSRNRWRRFLSRRKESSMQS